MMSQLNSKRLFLWSDIATTHQQERKQDIYLLQYTKSELASRLSCQKGGISVKWLGWEPDCMGSGGDWG